MIGPLPLPPPHPPALMKIESHNQQSIAEVQSGMRHSI